MILYMCNVHDTAPATPITPGFPYTLELVPLLQSDIIRDNNSGITV